jgi:hypothetical protein
MQISLSAGPLGLGIVDASSERSIRGNPEPRVTLVEAEKKRY